MEMITAFAIAFLFSFVGTIPPGTLNLTIIEIGLQRRVNAAWRFAIAAAMIEYGYAWIAIAFEREVSSSAMLKDTLIVATPLVLIVLGVLSLIFSSSGEKSGAGSFVRSGFRRGLVLSMLNPMALPFWIAMTAYIRSQNWITLSTQPEVHAYLSGVSAGAIAFLMLAAYTARSAVRNFGNNAVLRRIPATAMIALGLYGLMALILD